MGQDQTEPAVYLDSVVSSGRDLTTSMGLLIDYCQEQHPAAIWEKLRQLDYAADAEGLRNWLGALLLAEPPGANIEALWFGLQIEGVLEAPEGYVFYMAGSDRFDLRDPKWNHLPVYWPSGRKANSPLLEELLQTLEEAGGRVLTLGQYMLGLGYCCLAVATVCAAVDLRLLLGDRKERHVAVGFDEGDYMVVGKADRDGWHRVTSPAEQIEAAAARPKKASARVAGAAAPKRKRQGSALGRLLRAIGSALNGGGQREPEPPSAPKERSAEISVARPPDVAPVARPPDVAPVAPAEPVAPPERMPKPATVEGATADTEEAVRELLAPKTSLPKRREAARALPAPEAMRANAEDAVELALTRFGIELDYSEQSLQSVEWILATLYDAAHPKDRLDELMERVLGDRYDLFARYFPRKDLPQTLTDHQLWQMAMIWGAYVGEVMRQRWDGEWVMEGAAHGEAVVALHLQEDTLYPLAKVYDRLANGPGDNIWFYYRTLKERLEVPL